MINNNTSNKNVEEKSISIPSKDSKILWARAAGRCSLATCRLELTLEKKKQGMLTYGEMCHIVGEKTKAARGVSLMETKQRNEYHNLILLCANHHKQIDADEEKYPIEILHEIKANHEQWVQESLSSTKPSPGDLLYTSLIDSLSSKLKLDDWDIFVDNASRNVISGYYIDVFDLMVKRSMEIEFDGDKPEIEEPISNLINSYIEFVDFFLTFSAPRANGSDFHGPDLSYKRMFPNPNYDYFVAKHSIWARRGFTLLCIYTARLNEFVKAVRKQYNPYFYIVRGRFIVSDGMGVHNGGQPSLIRPTYELAKKRLDVLDLEIKNFKSTHGRKY